MHRLVIILAASLTLASAPVIARDISSIQQLIDQQQLSEAEKFLSQYLLIEPNNRLYQFKLAQVLAWQKKYLQALEYLNILLQNEPDNTDYLLAKIRVIYWSGDYKHAIELIEPLNLQNALGAEGLQLHVQLLLARQRPGDYLLAEQKLDDAQSQYPHHEWQFLKDQLHQPENTGIVQVEAGTGLELLSRSLHNWSTHYLAGSLKRQRDEFYGTFELTNRFNISDTQLSTGYYRSINPSTSINTELSWSSSAQVLPEWTAQAVVNHRYSQHWGGFIGLRLSQYSAPHTRSAIAGLERFWDSYRFAYSLRPGRVSNAGSTVSHSIQLDYYYGKNNYRGCALSSGDEIEYDGSLNPPVSTIFNARCFGRHWFKKQWAVYYSIGHHQQGDLYHRNGLLAGIRYQY